MVRHQYEADGEGDAPLSKIVPTVSKNRPAPGFNWRPLGRQGASESTPQRT